MRFTLILFFSLIAVLFGRENPFVPIDDTVESQIHSKDSGDIVILTDEEAVALEQDAEEVNVTEKKPEIIEKKTKPQIINYQQIRLIVTGESIQIETKDILKKHFSISNPTRLILDFKSDVIYPSRNKKIKISPFSVLRIGSHKGYYRVVLELEHPVKYKVSKYKFGYILTLH